MPAPTNKMLLAEDYVERVKEDFPPYVQDYIDAKSSLSPTTLKGYLHDYKRFFQWIIDYKNRKNERLTDAEIIHDVPHEVLEHLPKKVMDEFFKELEKTKVKKSKKVFVDRSEDSVTRYIQSLKSLFNYLTQESEVEETGECLFTRNVMAKIKTPKKSESTAKRAKRINNIVMTSEQMEDFLEYVKYQYIETLTPGNQKRFLNNRLRDVAIISLLQGSGIRVNELAGLLVSDIDFVNGDINVLRKGNKEDLVSITPLALEDLGAYLEEREDRYRPDPSNQFVFLSRYKGAAQPLSVESVQKIVNKYSKAFFSGRKLSPHKLRHSFANSWLENDGSLVSILI